MTVCLLALATGAFAQNVVKGQVTDNSGDPLIGVTVLVDGTLIGTSTDINGNFELDAPSAEGSLEVSYIGYKTQNVPYVGKDFVNVLLIEDVNQLDEVVVTGLASSVKRSNLANAIATIDAEQLTGVTTQPTVDGALYGKFTGADIRSNSGAPGGGFSVRLRGVTSINLNQQPLFIIDGIFLDNSSIPLGTDIVTAAAGGGNTSSNQDDASNRIADIIPEDIESIEILKGASAAAVYGVGGAGGVVIITTKNGGYNQDNRISFSQTIGTQKPITKLGDRGWDEAKVRDVFGDDEVERFRANGVQDYETLIFDSNSPLRSVSALSFSGGSDKTKYYVSGTYRNEDGLVPNTGYEKASVRLNIGQKISDRIEVNLATSYVSGTADRGLFNNSNANTTVGYALAFTRPWDDLLQDENGNFPGNPRVGSNALETVNTITNRESINRFFGSLKATYSILQDANQSLKFGVEGGLDTYSHEARGLFPRILSYYRDPNSLGGASIQGFTGSTRTNMSAYLAHNLVTESSINIATQVGVQQLDFDQNNLTTIATGLNGSQENVDQAANQSVTQTRQLEQVKSVFGQTQINVDDKIIATVGVRGDKSSNNGDPNEIIWSPKASLAVNIHELTPISSDIISAVKPRVAWGRSARFAGFNDRFNALNPSAIQGNAGLITNPLLGNPDVRPESQTELEFGIDLGFLDDRFVLGATFYQKNIDDLLLRAQVPASTGFTNQVTNAGELENKGIEIQLQGALVQSDKVSWSTGINWWRNRSEITRLDVPAFNIGGFAAFLGQGRIEEGGSATQLIGTIDPSRCDGDDCSNVDPEGDGFMTFGDMEPDFNMSWTNGVSIGDLDIDFLWHWKKGGDGINLSTLLYDLGGVTWDFDDTTLDPSGDLSNGDFRLAALGVHPDVYIEDASYIRLREIGVYYNFRDKISFGDVRVGVSARNLINIFDYNSYDPEVSNFGNNVLINSVEVTPYPSAKSFNFHLNITL